MSLPSYRYGSWSGGRDPLEPPYDVASALDEIGDQVLAGASPRQALRELLRRGTDGLRGLDDLRRQVAKRRYWVPNLRLSVTVRSSWAK